MGNDMQAIGSAINSAIATMRGVYSESYKLFEELEGSIQELNADLEPFPTWTWESQNAQVPDACLRARLARYFVPAGSILGNRPEGDEPDTNGRHHLQLKSSSSAFFADIEFYDKQGKIPKPMMFYGAVDLFSGGFLAGDTALLHRGDLAALLESADHRQTGTFQPVHGRTLIRRARMLLKVWSPLAAIRSATDIEQLAKQLVAAFKEPAILARVDS